MLVVAPFCEIAAEPVTTVPPVGPARAGRCRIISAATAVIVAKQLCVRRGEKRRFWLGGSETGTSIANTCCARQPTPEDIATPQHHQGTSGAPRHSEIS